MEELCITIAMGISYPFLNSDGYRFSSILGKVIYREMDADKSYRICIYDLNTEKKLITGLSTNKIQLYSVDEYQFSFLGNNFILYGTNNRNPLKRIKYWLEILSSGFMKNDPPLTYKIFDLERKKTIGYFKNIDTFDIIMYY